MVGSKSHEKNPSSWTSVTSEVDAQGALSHTQTSTTFFDKRDRHASTQ